MFFDLLGVCRPRSDAFGGKGRRVAHGGQPPGMHRWCQSSLNHRAEAMKETTSKMTSGSACKMDAGQTSVDAVATDCKKAGCRRRTHAVASDGSRNSYTLSIVVLSAAVVACTAAVDWGRVASIYRHWLSTTAELLSITDQKVTKYRKRQ